MAKTWCVDGRHYRNTNNILENEKQNPKIKKIDKIRIGKCDICERNKSQIPY